MTTTDKRPPCKNSIFIQDQSSWEYSQRGRGLSENAIFQDYSTTSRHRSVGGYRKYQTVNTNAIKKNIRKTATLCDNMESPPKNRLYEYRTTARCDSQKKIIAIDQRFEKTYGRLLKKRCD